MPPKLPVSPNLMHGTLKEGNQSRTTKLFKMISGEITGHRSIRKQLFKNRNIGKLTEKKSKQVMDQINKIISLQKALIKSWLR